MMLWMSWGLTEIYMSKAIYTWWNKKKGDASIRAKLDREFSNKGFHNLQAHCTIMVRPMLSSDHHGLILRPTTPRINNISVERRPSSIEH